MILAGMISLYTVLFFIALAQCSIVLVDDECVKRCAEDLPEARLRAMVICMDVCKQPKRSYTIEEDSNDEPNIINSAANIFYFLKDVFNTLIMLSNRFPPSEDRSSDRFFTFLESNSLNSNIDEDLPIIFRKKRDAEFSANLRGRAQADTLSDFTLDSAGLRGNANTVLGYEGEGRGTGRLSAGALDLQGDWEGDVAGAGELGLHGNIAGLNSGFSGEWEHAGEANVGGKGVANVYGVTIGGAGGRLNAKYAGQGSMIGGLGRGGLVGLEYEAENSGSLYGAGAAGIGHPALGIGAGIVGEGGGEAMSRGTGGLGLMYGPNGFGIQGKSQTQTNLAGGLDLSGGIGSYEKYSNEQVWRGE